MGFVISMNVSKQEVDTLRGGLVLIFSSKCPMRSIIMEKGKNLIYLIVIFLERK